MSIMHLNISHSKSQTRRQNRISVRHRHGVAERTNAPLRETFTALQTASLDPRRIGAITTALLTTIGSAIGWDKAVLVVLGAITTALTTLTGLLRPASKWRSNRLSHSEAEAIRRYLMQDKASPDKALQRIAALAERGTYYVL